MRGVGQEVWNQGVPVADVVNHFLVGNKTFELNNRTAEQEGCQSCAIAHGIYPPLPLRDCCQADRCVVNGEIGL